MTIKDFRADNKLGDIPVGCVFKHNNGEWYMKILTEGGLYFSVHLETGMAYDILFPNDIVDVPAEVELQVLE